MEPVEPTLSIALLLLKTARLILALEIQSLTFRITISYGMQEALTILASLLMI